MFALLFYIFDFFYNHTSIRLIWESKAEQRPSKIQKGTNIPFFKDICITEYFDRQ